MLFEQLLNTRPRLKGFKHNLRRLGRSPYSKGFFSIGADHEHGNLVFLFPQFSAAPSPPSPGIERSVISKSMADRPGIPSAIPVRGFQHEISRLAEGFLEEGRPPVIIDDQNGFFSFATAESFANIPLKGLAPGFCPILPSRRGMSPHPDPAA